MAEAGNDAAEPMQCVDIQGDGRWMSMHKRFCHESHDKEADVIFIGDSLVFHMQDTDAWDKYITPFHCFNFGVGGDTTKQIMWRVKNGELDSVQTKVVVLWCGTNNHDHTAEQVANGICEITKEIHKKQSGCKIIVLSLLPRGEKPNKLREKNKLINEKLKDFIKDSFNISYLDVTEGLVSEDGLISHMDMPDYLHLRRKAYGNIVLKIYEEIHKLLPEYD